MSQQFIVQSINENQSLFYFFTIILIALVFFLVFYILTSYAFWTMARKASINHAWLVWIPFVKLWVIGELVTDKLGGNGGVKYLLATSVYIIVSYIPFINFIAMIAYTGFNVLIIYWIFKKYSNKPVLHTIISTLIPLYYAILLMVIRNNEAKN